MSKVELTHPPLAGLGFFWTWDFSKRKKIDLGLFETEWPPNFFLKQVEYNGIFWPCLVQQLINFMFLGNHKIAWIDLEVLREAFQTKKRGNLRNGPKRWWPSPHPPLAGLGLFLSWDFIYIGWFCTNTFHIQLVSKQFQGVISTLDQGSPFFSLESFPYILAENHAVMQAEIFPLARLRPTLYSVGCRIFRSACRLSKYRSRRRTWCSCRATVVEGCRLVTTEELFLNAYIMALRPLTDKFQYVSESLGQQLSKSYCPQA